MILKIIFIFLRELLKIQNFLIIKEDFYLEYFLKFFQIFLVDSLILYNFLIISIFLISIKLIIYIFYHFLHKIKKLIKHYNSKRLSFTKNLFIFLI